MERSLYGRTYKRRAILYTGKYLKGKNDDVLCMDSDTKMLKGYGMLCTEGQARSRCPGGQCGQQLKLFVLPKVGCCRRQYCSLTE